MRHEIITIAGKACELRSVIRVAAGEEVTIDLAAGGSWYGHGFNHDQPYPLESGVIDNPAFAVNNIQSPIWMCSAGYAFLAETYDRLSVMMNKDQDNTLRLCCQTDFTLRVFCGETLVEAWRDLMTHLQWKRPQPPAELIGDSLFCTWTQYPRAITQQRIVDMAQQIRERRYPCSTLIVDDRWESCFGELAFGPDFPDPAAMVRDLHAMGFRVILWVTPFVNKDSAVYDKLAASGALVQNKEGGGASNFRWWGGTAGLVDLTSESGQAWYRERLLYLKNQIGIDGFKIDGGDAKYMPDCNVSQWANNPGPSGYSDILLKLFEQIAPGTCETRTSWLSQRRNIISRQGGKDSHWGEDNGLKALVNIALHLSLMGYDMLIPDMVPGRVQTMDSSMALPTDELMVRWTEISALMPLIQFSYFPWNYCDKTNDVIRQYAELHKVLEPYIVAAAADETAPLIRPMWFNDPDNQECYALNDQYLLGNDLMVCPVLAPTVTSRSVLIPTGEWIDAWTGEIVPCGHQENVPAPCPGMPLYIRATQTELLKKVKRVLDQIRRGSVQSGITTTTYECGLDRDLSVTG